MNKAAKWKTHLNAEFSTCSFPSVVQGPGRARSWKTGRQAGRYQRVRQEVCAWHRQQGRPGFPGKKSESIVSSCAGSWRLNLQLHSTLRKLVRLPGYLGLLLVVVGCSPSSPVWEGEQRGEGVGVQPQGPGDLRSHRGSASLPTSISHDLSFSTFWVMKMFYNWIVVMVIVTQLSTFIGNHQGLKNKQEIKGEVRQLRNNTLHNAEHWGCPQPRVLTLALPPPVPGSLLC